MMRLDLQQIQALRKNELIEACKAADEKDILKKLTAVEDLNFFDEKGAAPLLRVCENKGLIDEKKITVIREFLKRGANINLAHQKTGKSALHLAAVNNYVGLMNFLLDNNALIEARDLSGVTPLIFCASFEGNKEAIRLLVRRGANVNARTNQNTLTYGGRMTALHFAVQDEQLENVKTLLECKADIRQKTAKGASIIELLASNEHLELHNFFGLDRDETRETELNFLNHWNKMVIIPPSSQAVQEKIKSIREQLESAVGDMSVGNIADRAGARMTVEALRRELEELTSRGLMESPSIHNLPLSYIQSINSLLDRANQNSQARIDAAIVQPAAPQLSAADAPVAGVTPPASPISIPAAPQQKDEKSLEQVATAHRLLDDYYKHINICLINYQRLASVNSLSEADRESLRDLIGFVRRQVENARQEESRLVEVKPSLTAAPIAVAPAAAIAQAALPLHAPASVAPRAAHFQPAEPAAPASVASQHRDEKALGLIKNSRDRLFEVGHLISEEDRGRFLERLAFYEKLAQHATLLPKDKVKLDETREEIEVACAKQQSLISFVAR